MTELGYRPEQHVTPGLRNGARVKCIRSDGFVDEGMTGVVTNTAPSRPLMSARARVLWDEDEGTQLACMIDADRLEVVSDEQQEAS